MLHTPLHRIHEELGARMVEFAGWHMPILYTSIVEEHLHTRQSCSLFDVSHMGRIDLTGPDAEALLNHVVTRDVRKTVVGQCAYAHVCREDGGILDDVLVYRYEDRWMMVCNASNRETILAWLMQHAEGREVEIVDRTIDTAMIAIQGPRALELFGKVVPLPVGDLKRYRFITGETLNMSYTVSRTGYTGEDGVEIIMPASAAEMAWQFLRADETLREQVRPAGLGARDTLRLEAAMPLYGHELTEKTDSITAGQSWCVHLDHEFIGSEALSKIKADGPAQKLIGLELAGKRIAREGWTLLHGDEAVGIVTSGTLSPTLGKSIAMGYLDRKWSEAGTALRTAPPGKTDRAEDATVVSLPFYKARK